jgi:hypothetical protein
MGDGIGLVALLHHKIGYVVTLHIAATAQPLPGYSSTMRPRSALDQSTVNRIHALSTQDLSLRAISRAVGVSHETVRAVLINDAA